MLAAAEVVAHRYGISREDQDRYGVVSHQKAHAAQLAGRLAKELSLLLAIWKWWTRRQE